jgi:4-phytase/acid phosphatase
MRGGAMRKAGWLAAVGLLASGAHAAPTPGADMRVESVVVVMRHGVRPPTKAPPMPKGVAAQDWPTWPVAPGWLTRHGGEAVERLGQVDAQVLRAQGVLPATACPAPGKVRVVADSDQRTIATAQHWLDAALPGCAIATDHLPQDEPDPRFNPLSMGLSRLDPALVSAALAQALGPGGVSGQEAAHRPLLTRIDAILCGPSGKDCGISAQPSALAPPKADGRPKLTGALDRGSTVAQILLLEYAEGKSMAQVGWGRATRRDITQFSALHALEFALLARPKTVAAPNLAGLLPLLRTGLAGQQKLTLIAGHDTNVANLGGLLDLHWHAPGFAPDDPAPGGAIVLERVVDRQGRAFIRAAYRSQTLSQIRSAQARPALYRRYMPIDDCGRLCPWDHFAALIAPD